MNSVPDPRWNLSLYAGSGGAGVGEIPHDEAGYMDISPEDKGENVRREICLTLEQMGIVPVSPHHEAGPGQEQIDFRCSDRFRQLITLLLSVRWSVR